MNKVYHFIGIGGIGMSALAHLLLKLGCRVSGSDLTITPVVEGLVKEGAVIYKGQVAENIEEQMTVIYSSDIKKENPEYRAAVEKNCLVWHRSELLAQLIEGKKSLAVAGTHGKTTTSALLAAVCVEEGGDPSFAVGGIIPQFQTNARHGHGDLFVIEADESDQTFLKYHPFGAIVTNIDSDHLVNYGGDYGKLIGAFSQFLGQVQNKSHLFWCGDDPQLKELGLPGESYGFGPECRWRLSKLIQQGFHLTFDLEGPTAFFKGIELNLIGLHNALNGAAVFGLALSLGISEQAIRRAFRSFQGVLRRCEVKGVFNEILFLDDYAHHPTEIAATLNGIRKAIGEKKLIAVYQPHRYTRTEECQGSFGGCFHEADHVVITDLYGAGEAPINGINTELVFNEVSRAVDSCQQINRTALSHQLSKIVNPSDVVVTLGAGDITKVGPETLVLLERGRR